MKFATPLFSLLAVISAFPATALAAKEYMNEIKIMDGHTKKSHVLSPLPHT